MPNWSHDSRRRLLIEGVGKRARLARRKALLDEETTSTNAPRLVHHHDQEAENGPLCSLAASGQHSSVCGRQDINALFCPIPLWMLCHEPICIPNNMASSKPSYLIVGAGVFGVSTAYHLIKKYPDRQVTIVDQDAYDADSRVAASWDWNKVVRADYDDIVYCQLALEAQDVFKEDPLWQPYFHETGIFWICRSDYAQEVIDNYKKLGRAADLQSVPIEEAKTMFGGLFEDANYDGAKSVLVNKTSGWAQAGDALRAVTKWSLEKGVKYVTEKVDSLDFDKSGSCTGVKTEQGSTISASHIILSTGAYTSKLLEQAAQKSGNENLRAGTRIVAGGITTGMTTLDDESYKRFKKMPVGVQGYTAAYGPFIGSLPPTKDRELKWWGEKIFKNTHEVLPGRFVSAPPSTKDYNQWDVPGPLKQDISHANHVFYGKNGANWKMEKHRICW